MLCLEDWWRSVEGVDQSVNYDALWVSALHLFECLKGRIKLLRKIHKPLLFGAQKGILLYLGGVWIKAVELFLQGCNDWVLFIALQHDANHHGRSQLNNRRLLWDEDNRSCLYHRSIENLVCVGVEYLVEVASTSCYSILKFLARDEDKWQRDISEKKMFKLFF